MMRITVADIMTRELVTLDASWNLQTTARLFAQRHIGGAPVVDAHGKPIGVVTLADLLAADPGATVAQVMSTFVVSMEPDRPLLEAVRLMAIDDIHRVLVVDDGRLVGIVTSMDIVRALASRTGGARLALDLRYCSDAEELG